MVQDQICSVVHSCSQMLNYTLAKLVDTEDKIVVVGHTIYEILKNVDAERVVQICVCAEREKHLMSFFIAQVLEKHIQTLVMHQ